MEKIYFEQIDEIWSLAFVVINGLPCVYVVCPDITLRIPLFLLDKLMTLTLEKPGVEWRALTLRMTQLPDGDILLNLGNDEICLPRGVAKAIASATTSVAQVLRRYSLI